MLKSKTLIVYGSRPEFLKVKPLFGKVAADTLHIGQHTNIIDFGNPTHYIPIDEEDGEGRLNKILSEISLKAPAIFKNYDRIIVQGDTASVFGAAVVAFHMQKQIIHLEAGLRSHNLKSPFSEEGHRQMVSRIATLHLCPTAYSAEILKRENVQGKIHIVGNTVLDNLIGVTSHYGNKVLVTIHRQENREKIVEILKEIDDAARENSELEFIFPVHPNPTFFNAARSVKNITITSALEHNKLIEILSSCRFIISDSGGIFEEGSFLGKKTIILRDHTERSEGIMSGHGTLCPIDNIRKEIDWHAKGKNHEIYIPCPFGDGFAVDKIKKILENA
jgi:UDP-N-acetylglucosamine 2-epimerase (non-hydrolysing)